MISISAFSSFSSIFSSEIYYLYLFNVTADPIERIILKIALNTVYKRMIIFIIFFH